MKASEITDRTGLVPVTTQARGGGVRWHLLEFLSGAGLGTLCGRYRGTRLLRRMAEDVVDVPGSGNTCQVCARTAATR